MNRHGRAPSRETPPQPWLRTANKSFSAVGQALDFADMDWHYLLDPQHLKHLKRGSHDEHRCRRTAALRAQPSQAVAARACQTYRRHQLDDLADRIEPDES